MFKCLAKQTGKVRDRPEQLTSMNKVKGMTVNPFVFKVIDFKYAIWGDPRI
jgi:hypothetical protein